MNIFWFKIRHNCQYCNRQASHFIDLGVYCPTISVCKTHVLLARAINLQGIGCRIWELPDGSKEKDR